MEFIPEETTKSLPASDVSINPNSREPAYSSYDYPHLQLSEYENDSIIEIRCNEIRKIHNRIEKVKNTKYTWHEILLSIGSITAGGFIGALISGLKLDSVLNVVVYAVCLAVSVGCFVGYFCTRNTINLTLQDFASYVEDHLVNPDSIEKEEIN